jgi:hypothetical protein
MNPKQAIALAIGVVLAIAIVEMPAAQTHVRHVSTRTLANGEIEDTYQSHQIVWKPAAYLFVVAATAYAVFSLRVIKTP